MAGKHLTVRTSGRDRPAFAAKRSTVLVKPISARCNLACRYCFYRDRLGDPYAGEPQRLMTSPVLASLIAQHMRQAGPVATFAWQGGEPTLAGLAFFRQAVAFQSRYGRQGQAVANALQTNATLLDREWARLLERYRFLVGVSLDGPRQFHDPWRPTSQGAPSYDDVMRGITLLRTFGVAINVLAVVHAGNCSRPEERLAFFAENRLLHLQFIPAVDWLEDGSLAPPSLHPQAWAEFLCGLFDAWYNDGRAMLSIRLFDNLVSLAAGLPAETCEMLPLCDQYYVVEYNGDVYPCDFFVSAPNRLGNLVSQPLSDILNSDQARRFASAKGDLPAACSGCRWLPICQGGCPRFRRPAPVPGSPEMAPPSPEPLACARASGPISASPKTMYLCGAMQLFLDHAWDRIQRLARNAIPMAGRGVRGGE